MNDEAVRKQINAVESHRDTWDGASLKRQRKDFIEFSKPFTGKTGAKLIGYEWPNIKIVEEDHRGEEYIHKYSDWSQADISVMTGRKFVHKFILQLTNGEITTLSAESAARTLGISEATARSKAAKLLEDEIQRAQKVEKALKEFAEYDKPENWHSNPGEAVAESRFGFLFQYRNWGQKEKEYEETYGYKNNVYADSDLELCYAKGKGFQKPPYIWHTVEDLELAAREGYINIRLRACEIWDRAGNIITEWNDRWIAKGDRLEKRYSEAIERREQEKDRSLGR